MLGIDCARFVLDLTASCQDFREALRRFEAARDQVPAEHRVPRAFRGNGKLTPEQEELRNLRTWVKQLEMEKDILKKATAGMPYQFFAKETR